MILVRWPTRATQKYKFQYNNIYSSTKIYIPVFLHPKNEIYFSLRKINPMRKNIAFDRLFSKSGLLALLLGLDSNITRFA